MEMIIYFTPIVRFSNFVQRMKYGKKRPLNEFITVQFMFVNSSVGTSETPVPLACNQQCQNSVANSQNKGEPLSSQNMADVQRCMAWKKQRAIEFKHPMRIIPPGRLLTSKQRLNGSFSCLFYRLPVFKYHLN